MNGCICAIVNFMGNTSNHQENQSIERVGVRTQDLRIKSTTIENPFRDSEAGTGVQPKQNPIEKMENGLPVVGIQPLKRRHKRAAITRLCRQCGREFHPTIYGVRSGRGHYCSYRCVGLKPKPSVTPESTHAERIRANGLINKRLKLNWFNRPSHCIECGKKAKTEFHHFDYSKPDHGYWLCRSCHMKVHRGTLTLTAKPVIADGSDGRGN